MISVAQRVVGKSNITTLRMRTLYAAALNNDPSATLDDVREAATTLEEISMIARRVLGSAHPLARAIEHNLKVVRSKLAAFAAP